ncbi:MAG: AraC-like DNA-binding protein [Myxococcota bacterium]|jgi:AraC-like DNA-binding protein
MLTVPDDFQRAHPSTASDVAVAIRYRASEPVLSVKVLVARPTFVFVRAGTKQLDARDGTVVTAEAGTLIAMRSGTHLMSEFRGPDVSYQSEVVSIDRSFARQAIGVPDRVIPGPAVAMMQPSEHVLGLFANLFDLWGGPASRFNKDYALREFLVAAMHDPLIRQLMFREVSDWGPSPTQRVTAITQAHFLQPLSVADLATLSAMSLSTFKRHFHEAMGKSPGIWLTQARLEHASRLLADGNQSVAQVSASCGYSDASTFIRAFRRTYSVTPLHFRKRSVQQSALTMTRTDTASHKRS